jgi:hypothetical protein
VVPSPVVTDTDQVEGLKNEADLVASEAIPLVLGHGGDIILVHSDPPRGRPVESAQEGEQRALARSGRPDDERANIVGEMER